MRDQFSAWPTGSGLPPSVLALLHTRLAEARAFVTGRADLAGLLTSLEPVRRGNVFADL
jgi:hypothetical protein